MTREALATHLATFQGAEFSYPFGPEVLVYKVRGKMFALISQGKKPASVTLKCAPDDAELLVAQFEAITPGYHMNKRHWITVNLSSDVAGTLLAGSATDSYNLVVSNLPQSERQALTAS